jgi:hypothetical protein
VSLAANAVGLFVKSPGAAIGALTTSPLVALATLTTACVLIVLSQMARATFDMARADSEPAADEDDDDR